MVLPVRPAQSLRMGGLRDAESAYLLTSTFLHFIPEHVSEQRDKAISPILHRP
jgi:hypothetical protein